MEIIPAPGKYIVKPHKSDMGPFEQVDSRVSEEGVVVQVGEGVTFIKAGDEIRFKAWGMDNYEEDGQKYFVGDVERRNLLLKKSNGTTA